MVRCPIHLDHVPALGWNDGSDTQIQEGVMGEVRGLGGGRRMMW